MNTTNPENGMKHFLIALAVVTARRVLATKVGQDVLGWANEQMGIQDPHRAAQELVQALALYPSHRMDARGPRGCLLRALEALEPEVARRIQNGEDPIHLLEDAEPC